DLESPGHFEQSILRRDRIELERRIVARRRRRVLKDFPGPCSVDHVGVMPDHECDSYALALRQGCRGRSRCTRRPKRAAEERDRGGERSANEMTAMHGDLLCGWMYITLDAA